MTLDTLCKTCRRIDFQSYVYAPDTTSDEEEAEPAYISAKAAVARGSSRISLGTLASVIKRAKACGFCSLIVDATTRVHTRAEKSEDDSNDGDSENDLNDDLDDNLDDDSDDDSDEESDDGSCDESEGEEDYGARFLRPIETLSGDGTEPNSDDDTADDTSILPTSDDGNPITCTLERELFCVLSDVQYNGKITELDVHRLVVSLSPSPWHNSEAFAKLRYQVCWNETDGDFIKGSGRKFSSIVDFERVKSWIRSCEECHGDQCSDPKWLGVWKQPELLRVIDVDMECITDAPPDCRYLALSYVWGQVPPEQHQLVTKTTTFNIGQLSKDNSMSSIMLPRTIRDSMTLTARLGERYLWVDAFCIVQDDLQEVAVQTGNMDLIYAGALVTIIAAGGEHADSGLSGMAEGSRQVVQGSVKVTENMSIVQTAEQGLSRNLKLSKWNSRGWTFQERLLSRRALIFTQDLLFWTCETSTWDEETILEPEKPEIWMDPSNIACNEDNEEDEERFALESLESYIRQYSSRKFTYGMDVLPAFLGVIQRMESLTTERFHWGLARTRFDQNLMWEYGDDRRTDSHRVVLDGGIVRYVPYPSWSWMGWAGTVSVPVFNKPLYKLTLAGNAESELKFYILMSDGSVQVIEGLISPGSDSSSTSSEGGSDEGSVEDLLRLWKGDTKVEGPLDPPSRSSISPNTTKLAISESGEGSETTGPRVGLPIYDTGCLIFWTSCAKIQTWDTASSILVFEIYIPNEDRKVQIGGNLPLSKGPFSQFGKAEEDIVPSSKAVDGSYVYDYIVISKRYVGPLDKHGGNTLNMLLVEWKDENRNIASRIGNAWMEERDWMCLDRAWKLVILE